MRIILSALGVIGLIFAILGLIHPRPVFLKVSKAKVVSAGLLISVAAFLIMMVIPSNRLASPVKQNKSSDPTKGVATAPPQPSPSEVTPENAFREAVSAYPPSIIEEYRYEPEQQKGIISFAENPTFPNYFITDDNINKIFAIESARIFWEAPGLEELEINIDSNGNVYQMDITRAEVEKWYQVDFRKINTKGSDAWQSQFINQYDSKESRKNFADEFVSVKAIRSDTPPPPSPDKKTPKDSSKEEYMAKILKALDGLKGFDINTHLATTDTIFGCVRAFSAYAGLADEGSKYALNDEEKDILQKYKDRVRSIQEMSFPKLRDQYGPAIRKVIQEHGITAVTIGKGYRTIRFSGSMFTNNQNIKDFQENFTPIFNQLRFTRSEYKSLNRGKEYANYTMDTHKDADLVVWIEGTEDRYVK